MDAVTLCHVPTTEDRRLAKAATKVRVPDADSAEVTLIGVDDLPYRCLFTEAAVDSIEALHGLLANLRTRIDTCVLRARPLASEGRRLLHRDTDTGDEPTLAEVGRTWVAIDLDSIPVPDGLSFPEQPHECALYARSLLPPEFQRTACVWRASGSAGFKPGIRLHLWFLLTRPVNGAELAVWLQDVPCDTAVFRANQPIFTADPVLVGDLPDPMVGGRIGCLGGNARVHVPVSIETTARAEPSPAGSTDDVLKAAALARWEAAHPWTPEGGSSHRYPCPACGSSDGIAVRADGRWNCHSSKHADVAPNIGTYTGSVHVGHRMEFQLGLSARETIRALKSGGYWIVPRYVPPAVEASPARAVGRVTKQPHVPDSEPSHVSAEPAGTGVIPARLDSKDIVSGVKSDSETPAAVETTARPEAAVETTAAAAPVVSPEPAGTVVSLGAYRASKLAVEPEPDASERTKYTRCLATVRSLCFGTEAIRVSIGWDERSRLVVLHGPPPWRPDDRRSYPRTLEDTDSTDLCQYLYEATGYAYAGRADCAACLETLAHNNPFDPVKTYLDGLEWTGTVGDAWHFLACVPGELLGVETTPGTAEGYTAAAFARWAIAAVQRTYEPGCQFREVLTLIGPQAVGKSQFLRSLCADPTWFSDTVGGGSDKDSRSALDGTWIVEFAELDKHMREDRTGAFKNFISTQVDRYRKAYARDDGNYKRRCVFAATSNYPDLFVDSSGNSRFNVLTVRAVNLPETVRRRDRIWAAAKCLYRAGEPSWLQPAEVAIARQVQAEHYNESTVEALVRELWEAPAPTEPRRPGLRDDIGFDWHPEQIGPDGLWCVLTTGQIRSHLRTQGYVQNVDRMIRSTCRAMGLVYGRLPREITSSRDRAWARPDAGPFSLQGAGR